MVSETKFVPREDIVDEILQKISEPTPFEGWEGWVSFVSQGHIECHLGCGANIEESEDKMAEHLRKDCKKMFLSCQCDEPDFIREEAERHVCVDLFINHLELKRSYSHDIPGPRPIYSHNLKVKVILAHFFNSCRNSKSGCAHSSSTTKFTHLLPA